MNDWAFQLNEAEHYEFIEALKNANRSIVDMGIAFRKMSDEAIEKAKTSYNVLIKWNDKFYRQSVHNGNKNATFVFRIKLCGLKRSVKKIL